MTAGLRHYFYHFFVHMHTWIIHVLNFGRDHRAHPTMASRVSTSASRGEKKHNDGGPASCHWASTYMPFSSFAAYGNAGLPTYTFYMNIKF